MPLPPPVTNATRPSRLGYDAVRIMRSSLCTVDLITLRAGGAGLVLAAAAGGSVARYRPWAARPFFCAEPVSHVTDGFNLAAAGRTHTVARVLAPGETSRGVVTLAVEQ